MSKATRAFVLAARVTLAGALPFGVAGCATNSVDTNGMRTTGINVPLIGGVGQKKFDQAAGRSIVIEAGLANPDPRVSEVTKRLACDSNLPQAERLKQAATVDQVLGKKPAISCVKPK